VPREAKVQALLSRVGLSFRSSSRGEGKTSAIDDEWRRWEGAAGVGGKLETRFGCVEECDEDGGAWEVEDIVRR
jgi:hypothetical protein